MADQKKHSNNQSKENKNAKSQNIKDQDGLIILGAEVSPERKVKKGKPLVLKDKNALEFFEAEESEEGEIEYILEKADLTQVEKKSSLKGKHKKSESEDETVVIKKDIISVAQVLLKVAGTSIAELSGDGKGKLSTLTSKIPLTSANDKPFIEQDISVITHQDIAKLEATKLKNDPLGKSAPFSAQAEIQNEADPVSDDAIEHTDFSDPLNNNFQRENTKRKAGFFHYFGMIALGLVALGGIGYGIIFITKLLTNDNKPDYVKIQEELKLNEKAENLTVKVKTPLLKEDPLVSEATSVIKQFLDAEVKRLAHTFVIQNKEVSKTFNKYWKLSESYESELLVFDKGYTLPNGAKWISFLYGKENQERQLVLIKTEDSPFRIDWQAYSEVESIPLADLIKEVKTEPKNIRAWIIPAHYYPTGYSDSHWQNYLAKDLEGNTLNCYVPLKTKSAEVIFEAIVSDPKPYPKAQEDDTGMYVKLMVRKPQIGAEFVEIIEVIDTTWHKEIED